MRKTLPSIQYIYLFTGIWCRVNVFYHSFFQQGQGVGGTGIKDSTTTTAATMAIIERGRVVSARGTGPKAALGTTVTKEVGSTPLNSLRQSGS